MRERKKNYATKEELWEELQELDVINKDLCQKLIASMPQRVYHSSDILYSIIFIYLSSKWSLCTQNLCKHL